MDVIKLLRSKNRCLLRLLDASTRFLKEQEEKPDGLDSSRVADFQVERDAIFRAFELFDRKLTEEISALPLERRTPELVQVARTVLAEKDRIIQEILRKDNEIMARIELEKSRLAGEISASRKSHDQVGRFKSSWVRQGGEGFDRKL